MPLDCLKKPRLETEKLKMKISGYQAQWMAQQKKHKPPWKKLLNRKPQAVRWEEVSPNGDRVVLSVDCPESPPPPKVRLFQKKSPKNPAQVATPPPSEEWIEQELERRAAFFMPQPPPLEEKAPPKVQPREEEDFEDF